MLRAVPLALLGSLIGALAAAPVLAAGPGFGYDHPSGYHPANPSYGFGGPRYGPAYGTGGPGYGWGGPGFGSGEPGYGRMALT